MTCLRSLYKEHMHQEVMQTHEGRGCHVQPNALLYTAVTQSEAGRFHASLIRCTSRLLGGRNTRYNRLQTKLQGGIP